MPSKRLAAGHRTNLPLRAAEHVIVDPPTNGTRVLEFRRAKKVKKKGKNNTVTSTCRQSKAKKKKNNNKDEILIVRSGSARDNRRNTTGTGAERDSTPPPVLGRADLLPAPAFCLHLGREVYIAACA